VRPGLPRKASLRARPRTVMRGLGLGRRKALSGRPGQCAAAQAVADQDDWAVLRGSLHDAQTDVISRLRDMPIHRS